MARNGTNGKASAHVRAKRERRRDEILRAALAAFRERGFQGSTLDHIAERLGVRKTALYHYFPDKDAILHACHVESLSQLERIIAEARELGSPREQLRHVIVEHVRVMAGSLDGSPLAFEVTAMGAKHQAEIIYGRDRYEREVRRIVESGIRDGSFRRVDAKIAAFAILGAINWVARWYRPEGALDADAIGAQFADHLVGGLAPQPRPRAAHARRAGARPRAARKART
jgi:TetR/AcrR family transcriptional regulator